MDVVQSSIAHSKYSNQIRITPKPAQISAKEQVAQTPKPKNAQIKKCIKRLSAKKLFGYPHVKRYLYDLYRRGCRPNTIRSNFESIILFISYIKNNGRTCLEAVTRNDLSSFIEHEQDRGLKPNTVSTRLRALYAFLSYLVEREIVHPDVTRKKMYIKVPDALPRAIDPEDVRHLLSVIKKTRDWAMILILLRTGMRIGELLDTRVSDINLREKRIEVYEASKNRVGRVVYLSDDARCALKVWLKKRDPHKENLFYGPGRSKTLSYEAARMMFHRYIDKQGMP
jgi:site-specific recombinase XerD